MDSEYVKECFINMFEFPFSDFKNKSEIITQIKDMPLSAKTVRDRTVRMAAVTNCLKSKVLNINTISIETDGYQSMKCANKNFVSLL